MGNGSSVVVTFFTVCGGIASNDT